MAARIYFWVKWLILAFVLASVVITIITLTFKDFKPNPNFMGKKRPPIDRSYQTKIDQALDPILAEHAGETGLVLLEDNLDAFAIRAITARNAERTLDVQYYIWNDDLTGHMLGMELLKAADRGVFVRILLDDLNAINKDSVLSGLAGHPQIEIRLFNPIHSRQNIITRSVEMVFRGLSLNRRMHNKAWIADSQLAIIGGRNIGNEYFDADPETNFFDVDILLAGKAVGETEAIFDQFWNSPAVIPFKQIMPWKKKSLQKLRDRELEIDASEHDIRELYLAEIKASPSIRELFLGERKIIWTDKAHVYSDPPEKVFDEKEDEWLVNTVLHRAWSSASEEFYLISPYFVPGEAGVTQICDLRERNVNVQILTNSLAANDVMMVHGGYAPYRKPLLECGATLYELMPFNMGKRQGIGAKGASLHTKAFIIDNRLSFIGSFNHDPRSARLNTEMGILFESEAITDSLKDLYENHVTQQNSYTLFLEEGKIRWRDEAEGNPKIWTREPETGLIKRAMTKIVSWLPIESQL